MTTIALSVEKVRATRIILEQQIELAKEHLENKKCELAELQASCTHPNKQSQPEYDFLANWCNDCGKWWSARR